MVIGAVFLRIQMRQTNRPQYTKMLRLSSYIRFALDIYRMRTSCTTWLLQYDPTMLPNPHGRHFVAYPTSMVIFYLRKFLSRYEPDAAQCRGFVKARATTKPDCTLSGEVLTFHAYRAYDSSRLIFLYSASLKVVFLFIFGRSINPHRKPSGPLTSRSDTCKTFTFIDYLDCLHFLQDPRPSLPSPHS